MHFTHMRFALALFDDLQCLKYYYICRNCTTLESHTGGEPLEAVESVESETRSNVTAVNLATEKCVNNSKLENVHRECENIFRCLAACRGEI